MRLADMCPECREKQRTWSSEHNRSQYRARKSAGLCVGCGKSAPSAGKAYCADCIQRINDTQRKTYVLTCVKCSAKLASANKTLMCRPCTTRLRKAGEALTGRTADMLKDFLAGDTYARIGRVHGLSRERVRQILRPFVGKMARRRRPLFEGKA